MVVDTSGSQASVTAVDDTTHCTRGIALRSPFTVAPAVTPVRASLSPRVAARNLWLRIEALRRNRAFLDAYRAARALWLAGLDVVFPAGTYWLHRFAGVPVAPLVKS